MSAKVQSTRLNAGSPALYMATISEKLVNFTARLTLPTRSAGCATLMISVAFWEVVELGLMTRTLETLLVDVGGPLVGPLAEAPHCSTVSPFGQQPEPPSTQ
jgi:hypothetical protein